MTILINGSPKYPGDPIRTAFLRRGDELGDVRVQWYDHNSYRIASFTPGYETSYPGDTPKMNPDRDEWCKTPFDANRVFKRLVTAAHLDGWVEYDPNEQRSKTLTRKGLLEAAKAVERARSTSAPMPGYPHSDVELGVRRSDLQIAINEHCDTQTRDQIRRRARQLAIARNRAASMQADVSGRSACYRPLFEDR